MSKRNTAGLRSFSTMPAARARAIQSAGGRAAAKKRREAREAALVKDAVLSVLSLPARRGKFKASAELDCFEDAVSGNTTLMVKMLVPLIQAVMGGDIEALFLLLRVLGQEPGTPGQFGINPYMPPASAADAPSEANSREGIHTFTYCAAKSPQRRPAWAQRRNSTHNCIKAHRGIADFLDCPAGLFSLLS